MRVNLREKPITDNRYSLYLDFYPAIPNPTTGGKTRREFLDLFIYSDVALHEERYTDDKGKEQRRIVPLLKNGNPQKLRLTELQKKHNRETIDLAENIKAQRQLDIQAGNYGFLAKDNAPVDFLAYFKSMADEKTDANGHSHGWQAAYQFFVEYTGGMCFTDNVSTDLVIGFKEYLLTANTRNKKMKRKLGQGSASLYFSLLKSVVKRAAEVDKIIKENYGNGVAKIKTPETQREFLTLEELQKLAKQPMDYQELKNACLFSALTGLRYGDIEKLKWGEIQHSEASGYYIRYSQEKTDHVETLPISETAYSLLGERGEPSERVFPTILYSAWQTDFIKAWVKSAGITKDITFHNFRHTYATLLLTKKVPIYTVSKMLGHKNIKTTQIYANIIDEQKKEAANVIDIKLD